MSDDPFIKSDFLKQITEVIEENLSNEQFGVSELAHEMNMSRSNLLRKVKKLSRLSVSQFIRQVRLKRAMEMLKQTSSTVSEISYQVGFNSTSYFIKCFREHYGYPPGEAEERNFDESEVKNPTLSHQLAAIMFTDIKGYTALMQQDEGKALEFRNRHRQIFNTVTKKFKGKILQYYGDGTLSIFQSAIDAVKCGIDLQLAFRLEPPIPVRIGIHSGDIIVNEEDIIGDGVNVASRIESLAVAGSVFISGKVHDEVKNQSGIQTASMGVFEFKNVDKPIEVFAITNPGLIIPQKDQLRGKLKRESIPPDKPLSLEGKNLRLNWILIAIAALIVGYLLYNTGILTKISSPLSSKDQTMQEKSIAVLPFINDSNDSTNVYIINGLMESILNHLQKIEGLRVISRTSVEKYRSHPKTVTEIAQELNIKYVVEGSGQKIGNQILLNIQLIEAPTDRHLWSEQYNRGTADIFGLQREVAKNIAKEIQVILTPEVEKRIDKDPTKNLDAYDTYLKGREFMFTGIIEGSRDYLEKAIRHYEQAVEQDPEFALAYAGLANAYFFIDYNQADKQYEEQINNYADKAMVYDPQLPQSLIAKALYYLYREEYTLALPHLEKAHEYNPNSALVINILADYYTRYVPNTEKYLEYALKGTRLDIASNDSITASFIYLHLSNAFIQSGFVEEAEAYVNKSLSYEPENLYSEYVKAYILYAKNQNLNQTKELLLETLSKDSTRLDVMQEVAKIHYFMQDYEGAYKYYKKFTGIKEALNLDIYPVENAKIAMVMRKMGMQAEAEKYMQQFSDYTTNDESIYRDLNMAMISAFNGDTESAIEQLRKFSEKENYHYWTLLFFEMDPVMEEIKDLPAFQEIMDDIEIEFWDRHEEIKVRLKEMNLI